MLDVFTPLNEGRTERLSFPAKDVKVLSGSINMRGRGYHATVEIYGNRYKVVGRSCGAVGCMCDAELIADIPY